uniref:Integrase, catalytic region, zinc finger, CCHC-type, peptidase aspartic, catalytic n=1 Tax=Tanacetum cinerariifolium TaxID=118510 RepID=A0A6L2LBB8_TANCI|nr:integrase, catalytic region, zinc finger, CCHC-type, peptidase aspartic, catalytic [Tanacetum cinerariifolium]
MAFTSSLNPLAYIFEVFSSINSKAKQPLTGYVGNSNNNNGWIEADVPLLGEFGVVANEPMVCPIVDEIAEPIVKVEEQVITLVVDVDEDIAMLFGDDASKHDVSEGFDEEEVWEVNEEWLMAPVTPPSMPSVPPSSIYEVKLCQFQNSVAFCVTSCCVLAKKTSCVLLKDTRPPMLDRTDFASWQQRIRLYGRGKDNGVNILKSTDEGPYKLGTFRETLAESTEGTPQFGLERPRVYSDLNSKERDRYNDDIRATNILLQGFPKDIYTLINHYTDAKDIWDNVKMLLEGSELTKEDRESQLYDDFEHFR